MGASKSEVNPIETQNVSHPSVSVEYTQQRQLKEDRAFQAQHPDPTGASHTHMVSGGAARSRGKYRPSSGGDCGG